MLQHFGQPIRQGLLRLPQSNETVFSLVIFDNVKTYGFAPSQCKRIKHLNTSGLKSRHCDIYNPNPDPQPNIHPKSTISFHRLLHYAVATYQESWSIVN